MAQAADYAAAYHWMRAVQVVGNLDAEAVAAKMRAMPVNDFFHDNVPVAANGQVLGPMYFWRVKPGARATHRWDFYEPVATIAGKDAFMPLEETGCRMPGP
jgi:branched-chain amino acid transport system substrate-binding protein